MVKRPTHCFFYNPTQPIFSPLRLFGMKKLLVLWFLSVGICIVDACDYCQCDPVNEYFDYTQLRADSYINYGNLPLRFHLFPDDINYVADKAAEPCSWNGFTTAAYGCSCEYNGYSGPKYGMDSLTITADHPFNLDTPAGASLSPFFKMTNVQWTLQDTVKFDYFSPLSQGIVVQPFPNERTPLLVALVQEPDNMPAEGFVFTIICYKSDGSTASITTNAIRW